MIGLLVKLEFKVINLEIHLTLDKIRKLMQSYWEVKICLIVFNLRMIT